MARHLNWIVSGSVGAGVPRTLRNRLALTTILAVAPFMGYGRQAYADCLPGAPPTFVCSGTTVTTQNINTDDADVSTAPDFTLTAPAGNGINIEADGHLQFTDENARPITATNGYGLYVHSTANSAANAGAITINTNGNISGGDDGIHAYNEGTGSITITADGVVSGGNIGSTNGLYANNSSNGTDLTIVTGAGSQITGFGNGIDAENYGTGALSVTVNGLVASDPTSGSALYAHNLGTDLTIKTGAGSTVTGGNDGITALNDGSGSISITADGVVSGGTVGSTDGIYANNSSNGTDLTIVTGAGSQITGFGNGIDAENYGTGALSVTVKGLVASDPNSGSALYAHNLGTDLTITAEAGSTIRGGHDGITAYNDGSGDLEVTTDGEVTGYSGDGIYARNSSAGTDLTITAGAASVISGGDDGIDGVNLGTGDLEITANGQVSATNDGILAFNSVDGNNLTVTTGADSAVTGGNAGIYANNYGGGDLEINANGDVTGEGSDGIYALNDLDTGNLTITQGLGSVVTGADDGIDGVNLGTGDLEITANGTVTATNDGVLAFNSEYGNNLTIITGAQSNITAGNYGIYALNEGSGNLEITADGIATGNTYDGVSGINSPYGNNLTITVNGTAIGNGGDGVQGVQYGSGDLDITVNGTARGLGNNDTFAAGIYAYNKGSGETNIEVGADGLSEGLFAGIYAYSYDGQNIEITNDGTVRNLAVASDGFGIVTYGGATEITNNGILIGKVGTSLAIFPGFNDEMNNNGFWNMSGGASDFGPGDDEVNNAGTLLAANDPTTDESTEIRNIEEFNNNGGLVSLVDGKEGDVLELSGEGGDPVEYDATNGRLAVDAVLGPTGSGLSDVLFVDGNTDGTTLVHVNVIGATGANTDGIRVVSVSGTTAEEDFDLDGPLNAGFFTWDLRRDGNVHELFTSGVGVGSFEFAAGITGAQEVWHQTTGTLLQRQADLRSLLGGTGVTPVADYAEPVAPTPTAHITPGFWMRAIGAYIERDDEQDGFILDREQTIYGGMAGFDFGTESVDEAWLFGIFGGYLVSDLKFKETNSKWDYEGPTVGAYATYLNGDFHADATVKADFLDIDIDPDDLGSDDADTDALNLGGRLDAGYKIGDSVYIEPQATLAVVHTEIDDVDIFGGTVEFDDETSIRGRLGLRLGFDHADANQVVYSADVTGSVWEEFSGNNNVNIVDAGVPDFGASDDPGDTYWDVSAGFSMAAPDGWSGFIRANYLFADDYDAITGNAGVRWAW